MARIKLLFYWIIAWPAMLVYCLQKGENLRRINMDLDRFERVRCGKDCKSHFKCLYKTLVSSQEFRSLYYMRVGHYAKIIKYFLPGMPTCGIGSTKSPNVGGGVFIQHGWGMVLDAKSVGENLWINQNVTVGFRGNGHPTIGNNVRIGTGAVVLGDITIGDNVNIGANAIVVEDVPSNCTVCSPKASIVKQNGKRLNTSTLN